VSTPKKKPQVKRSAPELQPVVVRTRDAGVHFGILFWRSADGTQCRLLRSRRCWRFQIDAKHGASQVSCSELAVYGCGRDSKIAAEVASIDLVGVIEVIAATPAAATAIGGWSK
jgi:hypothetical protein